MSRQQFGKYAKQPDAPSKQRSGYNIAKWTEFVRTVKDRGLTGDGSLKDQKTLREIERLDILIAKERGALVDLRETETAYLKELQAMRKVIEDWRAHETAKHPAHVKIIGELADTLVDQIRDRVE